MVHPKLKTIQTDAGTLVASLRAEVGNAITTWILWRQARLQAQRLRTNDFANDLNNPNLSFWELLSDRLEEDVIAALSELAGKKIGRTNFYFAEEKLGLPHDGSKAFRDFIETFGFRSKRNREISHREQPENWLDPAFAPLHIKYATVLRGLAIATRSMKAIDLRFLGPQAPYLWHEVRKKRYVLVTPARVPYLLLPYMRLPDDVLQRLSCQT